MSEQNKSLINQQVGLRIRQLREALGWTQEELAKRVNLTRTSVVNIEAGRQGGVSVEMVERFAHAFAITPKHLMRGIWT